MSRQNSRSGLFLMEMIIVILFFSICAAICVNVFAKARVTADGARALNSAASRAANVAETYKAADGDIERAAQLLQSASGSDLESAEAVAEPDGSGSLTAVYEDMTIILSENSSGAADIKAYSSEPDGAAAGSPDEKGELFKMTVRA